jgi:hypothetical protein
LKTIAKLKDLEMEVCIVCRESVSTTLKSGVCAMCESMKKETVQQLQARILELERELQRQKIQSEKGDGYLQVMWGDNFNSDSLH